MHKYWLVMNPNDIEKRVNEMASQGWHLKKFTWIRFTFEQDEPGSYIYRHDELERFGSTYEDEYLDFLKSSGIEQVDRSGNFVFFRKPAYEGPFELYSDKKTKISNLSKKITLLSLILLLNLFFGIIGLISISGGQHTDMLKLLLNSTNILIVMLLVGPILKLMRVRKILKKELDVFSD
ncbi:DUF2812 domain-containing protein [Lysinibacillus pakistanensis]|uniref:DUF2812 domain-containing protein n=1 Tax=Lysinibacillus pakistanensis TaxID=759811 RepID=A0ABX6D8M5_9BACI|nr:DUF2812 domain-containing protein [Lysinibacillus pakistanensis]